MAASGDAVDKLYKLYEILTGPQADKHEAEYQQVLDLVSASPQTKQLAAQFVPKFFKLFPALADKAINAQIDLCEDENVLIRIHAIKGFPLFCKDTPEHTIKIADVLCQILVAEDAAELDAVKRSFNQLFEIDFNATVTVACQQIATSAEELIRERCFQLLFANLNERGAKIRSDANLEEFVGRELQKIIIDLSADEFRQVMKFYFGLNRFKSPLHRDELLQIIADQADLKTPLKADDGDHVERLITCSVAAITMVQRGCAPSAFVRYLGTQALPLIKAQALTEKQRLQLLQLFADFTAFASVTVDDITEYFPNLLDLAISYLPNPTDESPEPNVHFTYVEILLYALYQTTLKKADLSLGDNSTEKKLRYVMLAATNSLQASRTLIKTLGTAEQLDEVAAKLKTAEKAIKVTPNIVAIAKELCKPANARGRIQFVPSWHPVPTPPAATATAAAATPATRAAVRPNNPPSGEKQKVIVSAPVNAAIKRPTPDAAGGDVKRRVLQGVYRPPNLRDGASAVDTPINQNKVPPAPQQQQQQRRRNRPHSAGSTNGGRQKIVRRF